MSSAYDTADRTTNTSYADDLLSRTTKIAKAHTDQASASSASDLTVGYHANDMVASLSQTVPNGESGTAVSKQDFTLDGSDRVSTIKSFTDNVQLAEQTDHYDTDTDSPAWSETKTRPDASTTWQSAWSRNVSGLAGDLALTQASDGTFTLQLPNLHDDLAATVTIGASGIDGYTSNLEYGQTRDGAGGGDVYGWLGAKQRQSVGITGGLTLMSALLYNPTMGRFTSMDPVPGGNDNTYIYPADPVNMVDLDDQWGISRNRLPKVPRGVNRACSVGSMIPGAIGAGCSVYRVGYAWKTKGKKAALRESAGYFGGKVGAMKMKRLFGKKPRIKRAFTVRRVEAPRVLRRPYTGWASWLRVA